LIKSDGEIYYFLATVARWEIIEIFEVVNGEEGKAGGEKCHGKLKFA